MSSHHKEGEPVPLLDIEICHVLGVENSKGYQKYACRVFSLEPVPLPDTNSDEKHQADDKQGGSGEAPAEDVEHSEDVHGRVDRAGEVGHPEGGGRVDREGEVDDRLPAVGDAQVGQR